MSTRHSVVNNKKKSSKCIFEEIIQLLGSHAESNPFTNLDPVLLEKFYKPVSKKENASDYSSPNTANSKIASIKNTSENYTFTPAVSNEKKAQMESLRSQVSVCKMCRLHEKRTNTVFGDGALSAELMFIGEGPGKDEDLKGLPFVGKAGQLLTKMITAMQFDRREVYIANIVKCRPPNNRNPEDDEANTCISYLYRQIEIISPKVIILLGAVPLKHLLGLTGISEIHGTWHEFNGIKVMPVYHPAYLLRNPPAKAPVWEALKKVMAFFGKKPA